MKTCAEDFPTHPWVDTSKASSGSIFKSLQKRQIGLPIKGSLRDSTHDLCARDFWGYSCPSFSKDRRLLKYLTDRGLGNLHFKVEDNDVINLTEVLHTDLLASSSNEQFKPLFKTMDLFCGRKTRLLKARENALSVD